MGTPRASRPSTPAAGPRPVRGSDLDAGYASLSSRPWHVLLFLLPLIAAYEIGLILYLSGASGVGDISARTILRGLFDTFGPSSLHLPAIVLVVVLMLWHLIERGGWRVRPAVLGLMWLESFMWALPLLVLGAVVMSRPAGQPLAMADGVTALAQLPWQAKLTISIGAGLYEELVFRLVLITLIHLVVVDVLRLQSQAGYVIGAVVSAVLFALYHNVQHPGGGADMRLLAFYSIAGLYFAFLFAWRGFGIVVAAHAIYDAIVLLSVRSS